MESQPHNPEFRINPENFHTCRRSWSPHNSYFDTNLAELSLEALVD